MSRLIITETPAPLPNAPAGTGAIYKRQSDGHWIFKDAAGNEIDLSALGNPVFGTFAQYQRLNTSFSTTGVALVSAINPIITPSLPNGRYVISVQYMWAYDSGTQDFIAELQQNGSPLKRHQQEPKDTGGGGGGGTNQKHTGYMEDIVEVSGIQQFDFKIASSQAGIEAYVEFVLFKFYRWD